MKRRTTSQLRTLDPSALARVVGGVDTGAAESKSWLDTAKEWGGTALAGAGAMGGSLMQGMSNMVGGIGDAFSGMGRYAMNLLGLDKTAANPTAQTPSSPVQGPPQDGGAGDLLAKAMDGKDAKEVEEMITLYHMTNAPWWGKEIASAKGAGTEFGDLENPIDPFRTLNERKAGKEGVRGGDDLGPGFYLGNSKDFAEMYGKGFSEGGIVEFQIAKKELEALRYKEIAEDDDKTFGKFMKDGFPTMTKDGNLKEPKLDRKAPEFDVVSGPINDVDKVSEKYDAAPVNAKGTAYSPGEILKMGAATPLQYNFTTQAGVEALYGKSSNIQYHEYKKFIAEHQAAKASQ